MFQTLVSKENLTYKEWLSYRRTGLGGSDASIVAGLNPYKSPMELWLEKTGQIEPEEAGEAAYWGTMLEPLILDEFQKRTGLEVGQELSILQHTEYPFMLANVDGIAVCMETKKAFIFEAKTANAFKRPEWEISVPDMYQLQVQHYMAVTGFHGAYVAVLIGGQNFKYYLIERDQELIDLLIQLERRFWNYVVTKTPPPIDGSESSTLLLSKLYPVGLQTSMSLPKEAEELIHQFEEASEQEKQASEKKELAANKLKDLLKSNETGIINGRTVTWKTVETERLDSKKFKTEHPDLYSTLTNKSTYRRFSIK
jgi:putative phage-type endonuclease